MANRHSRNRIAPDPLFNYSQRQTASHQITSSESTTGQTHINYRTTGLHAPIPLPEEPDAMMVDDSELPGLLEVGGSDDEDEDEPVDEIPGLRVCVKKVPAKRYINSVCPVTRVLTLKPDQFGRTRLWRHGWIFGMNTWMSSYGWRAALTLLMVSVGGVRKRPPFDVRIVQEDICGA
jgi:hypothetical protein